MATRARSERWLACAVLSGAVLAGCSPTPGNAGECAPVVAENGKRNDRCLPVAPHDRRVDTGTPAFSHPTRVTNPLHPTSAVSQTIYGGQVDGKPFRTEVTLLPGTKTITWRGQRIEAVTVQYFALSAGRITEVALDWFAQADDGSVWYLGEDVFNYEDGVVADTNGTWVAGTRSPAAMIMPASPEPGDVYRPENTPGVVFEEVTVTSVSQTVSGPSGPVDGAITVEELHQDGTRENKTFAPGYGEFSTGDPSGDLEAASLALPTDALSGPPASTLDNLAGSVRRAADAVAAGDWATATTETGAVTAAWQTSRPVDAPLAMLGQQMDRDIGTLTETVRDHDTGAARDAALRIEQNELDVRSRHQPVASTDLARFALWAHQLDLDAAAGDRAGVAGDTECLKWTFDRLRDTVADPNAIDQALTAVRTAVERGDLTAAAEQARDLPNLANQR